jgi:hypothetical protein
MLVLFSAVADIAKKLQRRNIAKKYFADKNIRPQT